MAVRHMPIILYNNIKMMWKML